MTSNDKIVKDDTDEFKISFTDKEIKIFTLKNDKWKILTGNTEVNVLPERSDKDLLWLLKEIKRNIYKLSHPTDTGNPMYEDFLMNTINKDIMKLFFGDIKGNIPKLANKNVEN
jgi:hypothetical protein